MFLFLAGTCYLRGLCMSSDPFLRGKVALRVSPLSGKAVLYVFLCDC